MKTNLFWLVVVLMTVYTTISTTSLRAQATYDNNGVESATDPNLMVPMGTDRVVIVHGATFGTNQSATFNGTPMTPAISASPSSWVGRSTIYYLVLGTGAAVSGTVVVTGGGGGGPAKHVWAGSFQNVNQVNPIADFGSNVSLGGSSTINGLSASGVVDILIDGINTSPATAGSPGGGGTRLQNSSYSSNGAHACARFRQSTGGSESMAWSLMGGPDRAHTAIVLRGIDLLADVFCRAELPTGTELDSVTARHDRFLAGYNPPPPIPALAGLTIIPVQTHVIRMNDGTGGIAQADIDNEFLLVNNTYQGAGLVFVQCNTTNFIDDTEAFLIAGTDEGDMLAAANNVPNVLNIYFTDEVYFDAAMMESACGWATFSGDSDEYVMMDNDCATNTSTLTHEIGHFFDLFHTHETTFGDELVDGSNCMMAGDRICDTPADPNLSMNVDGVPSCMYTGMATDANMQMYSPSTSNIMSYSLKMCRTNLTAEQLAKVAFTAGDARSYVSPITCPSDQIAYVDANCQFVLPDYRDSLTFNADCMLVDTIQTPAPGTIVSSLTATPVTITVFDGNMDFSTCSFIVNTADSTPPMFANPVVPAPILTNASCQGILPDYRDSTSINDNCDLIPTLVQEPAPGTDLGGVGAMADVLLIAEDASGNADTMTIPVVVADANPDANLNCRDLNVSININGVADFELGELIPDANCTELYTIVIETEYGAQVYRDGDEMKTSLVSFFACDFRTQTLKATVTRQSDGNSCWSRLTFKQNTGPLFFQNNSQTVFCNNPLVDSGETFNFPPIAFTPCFGQEEVHFVADWVTPYPCESDTVKIIYREYEAFDKLGRRGSSIDTIVVVKLPEIVNVDLSINLRNLGCPEIDTLYCGINSLTDEDSITPVGPYMLVEESLFDPTADTDGDGINCDTIYFCGFKDGAFIDLFSGNGTKCGLNIHKEVEVFGGICDRQYKVTLDIKQSCSKTPQILDCIVPGADRNLQTISAGYYRCEFWVTDIDTTPPAFAPKIFQEFNCFSVDTSILSGGGGLQPVIFTSENECAAHTTVPPLCVFDDWSGIKAVKATIEGGGTYILNNDGEECAIVDFGNSFILLEDLLTSFGPGSDTLIDIIDSLGLLKEGYCYRSDQQIRLEKSDNPIRVFYEVMDSCHLVSYDTLYLEIKDDTKPVPAVDKGLSVSLSDKKVWVDAESFDEGSWDNCGVNMVLARRTDWREFCVDLCYNFDDSCKSEGICSLLGVD